VMNGMRLGGLGIFAGFAIGVLTWLADQQEGAVSWLGSLTAPWVLLAFLLGTLAGRFRTGIVVSVIAMLIGVAAYYICMRVFAGGVNLDYFLSTTVLWLILAPLAGVVFGAAGNVWRDRRRRPASRGFAVGLPGGVIAGESAFFMATAVTLTGAETILLLLFTGVGVGLPSFLPERRARLTGFGFVILFALIGVAIIPMIRLLVRLLGS
jgi:hypothetical protein